MTKVIDAITYHNEEDLFDLRYRMLEPYVDEFVVVESVTNFSGDPKQLNFPKIKDKYPKTTYYVNKDEYTPEEIAYAQSSNNTGGNQRWVHEFLQKESIQKALKHLDDEDMVFVGDVDEIWEPRLLNDYHKLRKLKLRVYTYYLNLRSDEQFWGTIQARYKDIKGQCLNHLRNNEEGKNTEDYCGWHFTNQGGMIAVQNKIYDQYNPEVFGNQTYYSLPDRFGKRDYIGRDFKLEVDESDWPQFLKDNRESYQHLLKTE